MPEELREQQVLLRQRGTVVRFEGPVGASTFAMEQGGGELLPGAGLALNQDGKLLSREPMKPIDGREKYVAVSDQPVASGAKRTSARLRRAGRFSGRCGRTRSP